MIEEDIEQYTDINTNNFFEEDIKSHDINLFLRIHHYLPFISISKITLNYCVITCLNFIPNYLENFSPPPEIA